MQIPGTCWEELKYEISMRNEMHLKIIDILKKENHSNWDIIDSVKLSAKLEQYFKSR